MMWWRMLLVSIRLIHPYWLAPWRSPLLRWRVETYGVVNARGRLLHAGELTAATVAVFAVRRRRELARFLRWAALL